MIFPMGSAVRVLLTVNNDDMGWTYECDGVEWEGAGHVEGGEEQDVLGDQLQDPN